MPQQAFADAAQHTEASEDAYDIYDVYCRDEVAAPAPEVDASNKWKQITVEMWRDAVYTNQTYFGELIDDTNEFPWWKLDAELESLCAPPRMSSVMLSVSTSIR